MPDNDKPVRKADLIADSLWDTVIWPEIRKIILDGANKVLSMLLKEPIRDSRTTRSDGRPVYRQFYDRGGESSQPAPTSSRMRSLDSFDDILFPDRGAAEITLEDLEELCWTDKNVTVGKFIDMAKQRGATINKNVDFPYWDYGWTSMEGVTCVSVGDDWWYIDLPPAKFLKNR
ncbi:MAG: hypothetical protein IJT28_08250 [Bacteroidaceae bacterium]|nr:hypothetical protein [Bacteroidaceae bacterium]